MSRPTWQILPQWGSQRVLDLTEFVDDIETIKGLEGYGAPNVRIVREQVPGMAGLRTRQVTHDIRTLKLPLVAQGRTPVELENTVRRLVKMTNAIRGECILRRRSADGLRVSDLRCRVVDGLQLNQGALIGPNRFRLTPVFEADDPYWESQPRTGLFTGASGYPWFPMIRKNQAWVASSSVLDSVEITTESDVETYPVWTVQGPGFDLRLINRVEEDGVEYEETLALTYELGADDTVVIDARDFKKTVTTIGGTNLFPNLASHDLWSLRPGINRLSLTMAGVADSSSIVYMYVDRTLMPL